MTLRFCLSTTWAVATLLFLCLVGSLPTTASTTAGTPHSSIATTTAGSPPQAHDSQILDDSGTKNKTSTETLKNPSETNVEATTLSSLPAWRQALPPTLRNKTRTLQRIVFPNPQTQCKVEVYLLGTAHVSMDSSRDVRLLLEAVEPSVLFLELCDQRIPMMLTPPPSPKSLEDKNNTETNNTRRILNRLKFWKGKEGRKKASPPPGQQRSMYGMASGLLTSMQEDYASSMGVELGGEFRTAYNYWEDQRKLRKLHLILGDRPLYLTLTRAWESLRVWGKMKLMVALLISSLQKPNPDELREWMQKILSDDTGDLLTESIAELAKHFPSLERVIIKERDAYMACKLYQTCRHLLDPRNVHTPPVRRMVAIVGAGHVQGMCHWLTKGNGQSAEEILDPLIQIKSRIPEEDRQILVHDVMEVNPDQLKAIAEEMEAYMGE